MSALPLPNGRAQFIDANGAPLVGGQVFTYVPTTTTPKSTWQDEGQTILNSNPIVLDDLGSASIWGGGSYRQIVYDVDGNLIWDQDTSTQINNTIDGDFSVTGPEAGFSFYDRSTDRKFTLYASGDYIRITDNATNDPLRFRYDGGFRIQGTNVYFDLCDRVNDPEDGGYTRTIPFETTSFFQFLAAGGQRTYLNTAPAGDFSSNILVEEWSTNMNETSDAGGRFPNGGMGYGNDGSRTFYSNVVNFISSNTLLSERQGAAVTTVVAGAITAFTTALPNHGGYSPGVHYTVAAQDLSNPSATGFVGQFTADGSGNLITPVVIAGGTGYTSPSFITLSVAPVPGSTQYDSGPQLNLIRDVNLGPNSFAAYIPFICRSTGSSNADLQLAAILCQVLDADLSNPLARLIFQTCGPGGLPVSTFYFDESFYRVGLNKPAAGYANMSGYQLSNGPTWTSGTGTPEGAVSASIGSLFSRTDGGAATSLYVKESGSGNTGWVAK